MHIKVILILSFAACARPHLPDPEFWEDFDKYAAECVNEVKGNADVLTNAWDKNCYPNRPEIRCYFKCLCLKLGIMNENGEVINDAFGKVSKDLIETDTTDAELNKCLNVKGRDACEVGFKLMACVRNATVDG